MVVCATLMIHNKAPVACSLCILAYDIIDSLELLSEVFLTGQLVLNELIMKKLALFGCTCLLVAHSVKDTVNVNRYAGLLFEDDDKKNKIAGKRKSAALLASRLLMVGVAGCMDILTQETVVYFCSFSRTSGRKTSTEEPFPFRFDPSNRHHTV